MSKVIKAAAKKWFYESFDCDLLEKMEKAGLIAQAEGFSISVMADLELDMADAFDRVTAERDAALALIKTHEDCMAHVLEREKELQQRLTAADERAAGMEAALRKIRLRLDAYAESDMRMPEPSVEVCQAIADAALKPAKGGGDEAI